MKTLPLTPAIVKQLVKHSPYSVEITPYTDHGGGVRVVVGFKDGRMRTSTCTDPDKAEATALRFLSEYTGGDEKERKATFEYGVANQKLRERLFAKYGRHPRTP